MQGWEIKGRRDIAYARVRSFMLDLKRMFLSNVIDMEAEVHSTGSRLKLKETFLLERHRISEGKKWGCNWESGYFRLTAQVGGDMAGKELAVQLNLGGEMLVYDDDGIPVCGLSNHSVYDDSNVKNLHRIGIREQGPLVLHVETAANELFGLAMDKHILHRSEKDAEGRWNGVFNYARLGVFEEENWNLYQDMEVLLSLYDSIDPLSTRGVRILSALFDAANAFSTYGVARSRKLVAIPLSCTTSSSTLSTNVIGHAHIDTAWLWPIAETHRKVARTFSSQIDLIKRYPGYLFGASSPQQYKWISSEHPELYAKIKEAVAAGRWEPLGGMWIEPDCNLISGESFVRQLLHGKRFFAEEFGKDVRTCWIPDVFGYPASMPQLLKRAGIDYFITIKMSWSKHNKFPYDTFIWKGLDGSEVLVHFPPEHDYNSKALPRNLISAENSFAEKDRLDSFLTLAGIGDGGGGPKEEHIERIRREKDLEGVPRASFGFVEPFMDSLAESRSMLMEYRGELYLEYHRGTYTVQGRTKRNNRLFEEMLKLVEALYCNSGDLEAYPDLSPDIEDGLTMQFHDILPGSSITKVYEEADAYYERIFSHFKTHIQSWLERNGIRATGLYSPAFEKKPDGPYRTAALFNPGVESRESVLLPMPDLGKNALLDGKYPVGSLDGRSYALMPLHHGWKGFTIEEDGEETVHDGPASVLENQVVRYSFDGQGRITEAFDKISGKDLFDGKPGNVLSLYHDEPHVYEAWDIDFYYPSMPCSTLVCQGLSGRTDNKAFSSVTFTYTTGLSVIRQHAVLPESGYELRFITFADWHEERKLLRVSFPFDQNCMWAECDIPYGTVERKTRVQNEWDFAKFEFPARNFVNADGIALASDCKYGYSAKDGILSLSLLRSPLYPDPHADVGKHEFTYSLIPHPGKTLDESDVRTRASILGSAMLSIVSNTMVGRTEGPYRLHGDGCYIGALKKAEDGAKRVIRIIEWKGKTSEVVLEAEDKDAVLVECDLLERPLIGGLRLEKELKFTIAPFEIRTFREE